MPIRTSAPIRVFDQESFHQVDKCVTGLAFEIHNEFGRYLDERLYQGVLTYRCRARGYEAVPEMQIDVCFSDFCKSLYVDILLNQGVIIETKTAAALAPAHRGQTLNYLFLCNLHHATLLNFGTERVQREFVSTQLTFTTRQCFELILEAWRPLSTRCQQLLQLIRELLSEWGAFLDPLLYREALTHCLGGEDRVVRDIGVYADNEAAIGLQKMHMLTEDIAFSVTASTHRSDLVLKHQQRFLMHTTLQAIQWINFNRHRIELRTIENQRVTKSWGTKS